MVVKRLNQRGIFVTKRVSLEKKIAKYYEETKNAAEVVEYLVAIMVRNALTLCDFSLILTDLVRELLLSAEPTAALRRFSPYFSEYFTEEEWQTVIARLYKNEEEYLQLTEETRSYKKYLAKGEGANAADADHQYTLLSTFKDINGKKHTWTLRDYDSSRKKQATRGALKILTLLTIFEVSETRRFAQLVKFKKFKISEEEEVMEPEEELIVGPDSILEEELPKAAADLAADQEQPEEKAAKQQDHSIASTATKTAPSKSKQRMKQAYTKPNAEKQKMFKEKLDQLQAGNDQEEPTEEFWEELEQELKRQKQEGKYLRWLGNQVRKKTGIPKERKKRKKR